MTPIKRKRSKIIDAYLYKGVRNPIFVLLIMVWMIPVVQSIIDLIILGRIRFDFLLNLLVTDGITMIVWTFFEIDTKVLIYIIYEKDYLT